MILGGAMIISLSAFKGAEIYAGENLSPVTVYFNGNPANSGEVSDESKWSTTPNGQTCSGEKKACSMEVQSSDLTSAGQLDPAQIQLDEIATSSGYVPERNGGDSETEIIIHNRN